MSSRTFLRAAESRGILAVTADFHQVVITREATRASGLFSASQSLQNQRPTMDEHCPVPSRRESIVVKHHSIDPLQSAAGSVGVDCGLPSGPK